MVKCCDGKLMIDFKSSFQSPEINPTLPTTKVKRISPSRRRRNQARAEQFRRNKDKADDLPASSKESQEEMQVSVSSPMSAVSALPSAAAKSVDDDERIEDKSSSWSSWAASFLSTPIGKGPPDLANSQKDAENSTSVSRAKRKVKRKEDKTKNATVNKKPAATVESSETFACVEAESLDSCRRDDRPELVRDEHNAAFTAEFLEDCLGGLQNRVQDTPDDPKLSDDIDNLSQFLSRAIQRNGGTGGGEGDEGQRIQQAKEAERRFLLSLQLKLQWLINRHKSQRQVHPRARAVSSYKDRSSAKVSKGKR